MSKKTHRVMSDHEPRKRMSKTLEKKQMMPSLRGKGDQDGLVDITI
jgi:hypothetical protein